MSTRSGWWLVAAIAAVAVPGCGSSPEDCADGAWVWADGDGDGFGAGDDTRYTCTPAAGEVANNDDCDDASAAVFPGADEACDGLDNDCDGAVDGGLPTTLWYADRDNDGFGNLDETVEACRAPDVSWVADATDCDDAAHAVFPGATEVCNGIDDDCDALGDEADDDLDPAGLTGWYPDADGDGYGVDGDPLMACDGPAGYTDAAGDCDDARINVHPGQPESCSAADDDCDGLLGDDDPDLDPASANAYYTDADGDGHGDASTVVYSCERDPSLGITDGDDCDDTDANWFRDQGWYADADGDGFGGGAEVAFQCTPPDDALLPQQLGLDCDDADADVNPAAPEVCDGRDDDCDGLTDDDDPSTDPATFSAFHRDQDQDGFGAAVADVLQCAPDAGAVVDASDCDDRDAAVNPLAVEVCNGYDDDCDLRPDMFDASLDPASETTFYADADDDGFGDPADASLACVPTAEYPVDNADDCDDADPRSTVEQGWLLDEDGDGVGDGVELTVACLAPGPGLAPASAGLDCDDADDAVFPGAVDPCDDLVDADCSGSTECASCAEWLAGFADSPSGVYPIEPVAGLFADVYCDMDTDEGGWTLVASSGAGVTLNDAGSFPTHANLTTLHPTTGHDTVWQGLRDLIPDTSDLRFACKLDAQSDAFDVDLTFYGVPWYHAFTTGTDAQSCFDQNNGAGAIAPMRRRNNLDGKELAEDNRWDFGYHEGEDSCGDTGDFTIDFDDRGMDSNELDGTDWGEDDARKKCGASDQGDAWFLFVREVR
ncbi:MAG: MopE-related protein [Myxococcota bacterium]